MIQILGLWVRSGSPRNQSHHQYSAQRCAISKALVCGHDRVQFLLNMRRVVALWMRALIVLVSLAYRSCSTEKPGYGICHLNVSNPKAGRTGVTMQSNYTLQNWALINKKLYLLLALEQVGIVYYSANVVFVQLCLQIERTKVD